MQIVRSLAGYTLAQADNIRRAMSKKKQKVIDAERKNFVEGNEEEQIAGCVGNGISREVANTIYDSMVDFAKYAFNKSHAAAYAVVAYQTAYLKYYHPVEFMAALMTSVIDNPGKVAEYIYTCKTMGIKILPPDINEGVAGFSVSGKHIRYGLASIKSVGWSVIDAIVREREENGTYSSLAEFAQRLTGKEINKRTIESFIKAGAFDSFGATRKQLMAVYMQILDNIATEKKTNMEGQMSLFDIVDDEQKESLKIKMPNIGEYEKEIILGYEKEVLGVYVSGHPLEADEGMLRKHISATTADFTLDEESGETKVTDGKRVTVGGMIENKTVKHTKNGKTMAFITLEDLVGTVEVIIWPNDYEKNARWLTEDSKVLIEGRVSAEEDKDAKLICERIIPFENIPKNIWIKFASREAYMEREQELFELIAPSDGNDTVVIYIEATKEMKKLPKNQSVLAGVDLLARLSEKFGAENVKIV